MLWRLLRSLVISSCIRVSAIIVSTGWAQRMIVMSMSYDWDSTTITVDSGELPGILTLCHCLQPKRNDHI